MKKFWMIGLLALASANSFQTIRATPDNIYKPIYEKLNVPRLPVDHINKAVSALEKQIQGGQSNQSQTSGLIKALNTIKRWDDTTDESAIDNSNKIVNYLSELGKVSSLLKETKPCSELIPIAQHIIHIKKETREKNIPSEDFGKIDEKTNIELIPLKFFQDGHIFESETLNKATVFELEQAMGRVAVINTKTRTKISDLNNKITENKKIEEEKIDSSFKPEDLKKIEEAVNGVFKSQSAAPVTPETPTQNNQKPEPKPKVQPRRQRRLNNNNNKGDKKGKKKSFWKKLRFWKWFGKKKKKKMNQTAAAPKRRLRSLKPTVTVTDVPAKNTSDTKNQAGANNNQQPTGPVFNL